MSRYRLKRNKIIDYWLSIPRLCWVIDVDDVRDLWKDYPGFQEIFANLLNDDDYDRAIIRAILDFNEQPPSCMFNPASWPLIYTPLLLKKSLLEVLRVIEKLHASNYFSGVSGGVNAPVHERWQAMAPIVQQLAAEVRERQQQIKTEMNYMDAFGGLDDYNAFI